MKGTQFFTVFVKAPTNFNYRQNKTKIHLVTPDWLWCCAERWEKAEEAIFPLVKSAPITLKPPAHCSSPEIAFAERCPQNISESSLMPESTNPFLAFSREDLKGMDKEVEEMLTSDEDEDSSETDSLNKKSTISSEEDSLTGMIYRR